MLRNGREFHLEEAIAAYASISERSLIHKAHVHLHVTSQAFLGNVLFCLGYPEQALAGMSGAIAEARRLAHPPTLVTVLCFGARVLSFDGDNTLLREWVDEAVATTAGRDLALLNAGTMIFAAGPRSKVAMWPEEYHFCALA
jgi:hypothetical protein